MTTTEQLELRVRKLELRIGTLERAQIETMRAMRAVRKDVQPKTRTQITKASAQDRIRLLLVAFCGETDTHHDMLLMHSQCAEHTLARRHFWYWLSSKHRIPIPAIAQFSAVSQTTVRRGVEIYGALVK